MSEITASVVRPRANLNFWQGDKIRLRAVEPEDAETFYTWGFDSEMARLLDYLWPPKSLAATREWAQRMATAEIEADRIFLVMEDKAGLAVGAISTHATNRRTGVFSYGLSVGIEHRGRGYASEAVIILLRYFFAELGYQKVNTTVLDGNLASTRLHEKLGFQLEGRIRNQSYTLGRYYDELCFGMLSEEFAAKYGFGGKD